jgi:hypothetical protein
MIHQQPMSTPLIKSAQAFLNREPTNTPDKASCSAPEIDGRFGQSSFGTMSSLPSGALRTGARPVRVVFVFKISSWTAPNISKELVRLVVDAVNTRISDLHASVERTGGPLEVDRVVGVVSQQGRGIETMDWGKFSRVDFLPKDERNSLVSCLRHTNQVVKPQSKKTNTHCHLDPILKI